MREQWRREKEAARDVALRTTFYANIRKRLGRISVDDWLLWNGRFFDIFQRHFPGRYDVQVGRGYILKTGEPSNIVFSFDGRTVREFEGRTPTEFFTSNPVDLEDVELDESVMEEMSESFTAGKFNKSHSISVQVKPKSREALESYAFGTVELIKGENGKFNYLRYSAQGDEGLIRSLHKGMLPRKLGERMAFVYDPTNQLARSFGD